MCSTIWPLTLGHCFGFFKGPMYGTPQLIPFTRALFCQNGCINFEIQGSKMCSTIRSLT